MSPNFQTVPPQVKKLFHLLGVASLALLSACGGDDDNNEVNLEQYNAWHDENVAWFNKEISKADPDGAGAFYEEVVPVWAQGQTIYMHWFNDRNETAMNLVPDLTSTIQAYYEGRLCNGTVFDKSENLSSKILTARVNGLIQGWQIALQKMHVGDTVQVIIPYQLAYGISGSGSIPPYSVLKFNMRLVDIPCYEVKP